MYSLVGDRTEMIEEISRVQCDVGVVTDNVWEALNE